MEQNDAIEHLSDAIRGHCRVARDCLLSALAAFRHIAGADSSPTAVSTTVRELLHWVGVAGDHMVSTYGVHECGEMYRQLYRAELILQSQVERLRSAHTTGTGAPITTTQAVIVIQRLERPLREAASRLEGVIPIDAKHPATAERVRRGRGAPRKDLEARWEEARSLHAVHGTWQRAATAYNAKHGTDYTGDKMRSWIRDLRKCQLRRKSKATRAAPNNGVAA